jgi:hypothetical protein
MTPQLSEKLFQQCVRVWLDKDLTPINFNPVMRGLLELDSPHLWGTELSKTMIDLDGQIEEWHARQDGWVTGLELTAELAAYRGQQEAIPVNAFKLIRLANHYGPEADLTGFMVKMGPFIPDWSKKGMIPPQCWELLSPDDHHIDEACVPLLHFLDLHGQLVVRGLCEEWCHETAKINLDGDEWHSCESWEEINTMCGFSSHREGGPRPTEWQLLTGSLRASDQLKEQGEMVLYWEHLRIWGRFTGTNDYTILAGDPGVRATVLKILEEAT